MIFKITKWREFVLRYSVSLSLPLSLSLVLNRRLTHTSQWPLVCVVRSAFALCFSVRRRKHSKCVL
jgi:hypothetical protein